MFLLIILLIFFPIILKCLVLLVNLKPPHGEMDCHPICLDHLELNLHIICTFITTNQFVINSKLSMNPLCANFVIKTPIKFETLYFILLFLLNSHDLNEYHQLQVCLEYFIRDLDQYFLLLFLLYLLLFLF